MNTFQNTDADLLCPVTPCPSIADPETPRPYVPFQDPNIPPKDVSEKAKMRMFKIKLLEEEQRQREQDELKMTEVGLRSSLLTCQTLTNLLTGATRYLVHVVPVSQVRVY